MKKKLLIVISVVLAVAAIVTASVVGTVAYLTSASKVSNVFTVGNVFITLDESEVDADGVPVAGGTRTDRNSYHLMPGKSYTKDPAITVAPDTASCYLFLVTRNQITDIEASTGTPIDGKPTMAQQMRKNGWAVYKDTSVGSRVWVYCGTDVTDVTNYTPVAVCGANITPVNTKTQRIAVDTRIPIFTEFHITTEQSANLNLYSGAEVTINAIGIQSDSFGEIGSIDSLDKAWAAVIAQYPYIQDNIGNTTPNT